MALDQQNGLSQQSKTQEKRTYDVQIAGVTLKLKSNLNEERVQRLSDYINQKINQVQSHNPQASFQNVLLLSSLHIAEDLLSFQQITKDELSEIKSETIQLLEELQSSPLNPEKLGARA